MKKWSEFSTIEHGFLILLFVLCAALVVVVIGLAWKWIRYSLFSRNNSKNYTGGDVAKYVLQKNGMNTEVKSSWLVVKYWNYNKRRNRLRLRPWTYHRRAIWTVMESAQQTYVASIRETNKKTYWLIFRMPWVIKVISSLLGTAGIIIACSKMNMHTVIDGKEHFALSFLLIITLSASVIGVGMGLAEIIKLHILRKNVVPMIKDAGFSQKELKAVQSIFNWRYAYAIIYGIIEVIKLIIRVIIAITKASQKSNN